jgi:hypothetical protein
MSPDHARALAMAYELQALMHGMVECKDNPRIDAALDLLDGVLDELDTVLPDHGKQTPHTLRLLVTAPREYEQHRAGEARELDQRRTGHALRLMATTPWRRP